MSHVEAKCTEVPLAQDVETARRLIQQHQELKKGELHIVRQNMTTNWSDRFENYSIIVIIR